MIIAVQCLISEELKQIYTILMMMQHTYTVDASLSLRNSSPLFCFFYFVCMLRTWQSRRLFLVKACGCLFSFCSGRNVGIELQDLCLKSSVR